MSKKPNLLFIWTDEQRADTLACYGNSFIQAPYLNRLAKESLIFDHAYCTQPVCTPSRATILTGLWPHTHGCIKNNTPLRPDQKTIAEMIEGYHCAYFGKWHLGDEIIAQHGFEDWLSIEDGMYRPFYSKSEYLEKFSDYHHYLQKFGYPPNAKASDGASVFERGYVAMLPAEHTKAGFLGREAADFIQKQKQGQERPWFLSVSFLEPHMPFFGSYNAKHNPEEVPVGPAFAQFPSSQEARKKQLKAEKYRDEGFDGHPLQTESDWRRLRANYYGLVSLVDESVGMILNALELSGQAENTIVVFTSDHGEMMGDHACLAKTLTYEESIRIPLLIKIPGIPGRHIPGRVSQIDLAPTLLDLLDQSIPSDLQGRSLRGVLEDKENLSENDVMVEWNGGDDWRTIVTSDGWKLNLCAHDQCELYHLTNDPHELNNLFNDPAQKSKIKELCDRIFKWQEETKDSVKVIR